MIKKLSVVIFLIGHMLSPICVFGQSGLEIAHESALSKINIASVEASISFLASDELGGRGTGTPEYSIASRYVASRFKNAGLSGGGRNESFFHEKEILLSRVPNNGIVFESTDGTPIPHLGLLSATNEAIKITDTAIPIDLKKLDEVPTGGHIAWTKQSGPTIEGKGRGGLAGLYPMAAKLKSIGFSIMILEVAENDFLIERASQLSRQFRPEDPRTSLALPVLLVKEGTMARIGAISLSIPTKHTEKYHARNVIGLLRGTDPLLADEAIVFSAHLDHLGRNETGTDMVFNGADDNASGVTAILTLADAFGASAVKPKRSILFIAFWGEESGLLGSKDFSERPTWPLEKMIANINIEMIGRPEAGASKKIWVTGWEKSDLGKIMNTAANDLNITIFEHPQYSAMLYRASDNWSLADKGVIAHSFSAGSLHGDYHQPGDEWQKLDLGHMVDVIRGLYAGSLPLVSGEKTPIAALK